MLLGNLTSILLTIVALLQALSWTIAGLLILATLSITTLLTIGKTGGTGGSQSRRSGNHPAMLDSKYPHERTHEKQAAPSHQMTGRPEQRSIPRPETSKSPSQLKSDFQRAMIPKITPPKTIPEVVSPAKSIPMKSTGLNQGMLRPIPPKTSPAIPSTPLALPKPQLGQPTTIERGDYASYDIQLDKGKAITCELNANGRVNFYLLDKDNLTSLDLGEEFWSEAGEEDTENATLEFVAPENGKWFLVVENTDNKEVSATVNIRKTTPKTGPSA